MKSNENRAINNKGITLIALVVTIIILIILATISVNMVFSENGLISKAKEAREHQANATISDQTELDKGAAEAANIIAGGSGGSGGTGLPDITPTTPAGTEVKKSSNWSNKVTAISDGSGNAIPLPNGFYYVGGNRTEGLVISDNVADKDRGTSYEIASTLVGNQFVWIPVESNETTFVGNEKPSSVGYSDGNGTQETADFNTMKIQVVKYKGFYIGRYEAGDATNGTKFRKETTEAHTVVVKKGIVPYNYVQWGINMEDIGNNSNPSGAVYLSKHMYDGKEQAESIVSTLCYGSQWSAMYNYVKNNVNKAPLQEELGLTGSVEEDENKNIYDLSGSCTEWTMEPASNNIQRTIRSGDYTNSIYVSGIAEKITNNPYTKSETISFRPTLYIKD